ncbi:MAG TPA: DinB family protein [Puia sp.]|nr:DinB family protein [Puia sp.]
MPTPEEIIIRIVRDAWNIYVERANKFFGSLRDEQFNLQVAPGRNTAVYLLGHLAAVHDNMLPLLGFGAKKYPALEEIFIKNPDRSGLPKPPLAELKQAWENVNAALKEHFDKLGTAQWFEKHTAISEADFEKEPHRNRLNVLVNRTNHLAGHYNQLLLLNK